MSQRDRLSRQVLDTVTAAYRTSSHAECRELLRHAIPDLITVDYSVEHAVTAIRVGMDSSRAITQDEQFKEVRAWLAAANGIEQIPLF